MRNAMKLAVLALGLGAVSTMSARPAQALCDDDCPFDHASIWKNCMAELDGNRCIYFDNHYYHNDSCF